MTSCHVCPILDEMEMHLDAYIFVPSANNPWFCDLSGATPFHQMKAYVLLKCSCYLD